MTGNSASESYLGYQSQPRVRPLPSGGPLRPLAPLAPSPDIQHYHQHHQGEPHKGPRASHRIQGAVNNVADVWRWQGPARAALVHGTPNVTYYLPAAPPPPPPEGKGNGGGRMACENDEDNRTQLLLMISVDYAVKKEHR